MEPLPRPRNQWTPRKHFESPWGLLAAEIKPPRQAVFFSGQTFPNQSHRQKCSRVKWHIALGPGPCYHPFSVMPLSPAMAFKENSREYMGSLPFGRNERGPGGRPPFRALPRSSPRLAEGKTPPERGLGNIARQESRACLFFRRIGHHLCRLWATARKPRKRADFRSTWIPRGSCRPKEMGDSLEKGA